MEAIAYGMPALACPGMPCVILLTAALCCMVQRQKTLLCMGRCETMPWDIVSWSAHSCAPDSPGRAAQGTEGEVSAG